MVDERPLFQHPQWMVGVMLILGALSLFVGLTVDPFWLAMGSPAILTLVVYVGVRIVLLFRMRAQAADDRGVESGGEADQGPETPSEPRNDNWSGPAR